MGTIFTILTVRIAFVMIGVMSILLMAFTVFTGRNQAPVDPFGSFADILPGQPWNAEKEQRFKCYLNLTPTYEEDCSMNLATGLFLKIQVSVSLPTGEIRKTIFIPRETSLRLGQLAILWGRPEVKVYSGIMNIRWPKAHTVAIPQSDFAKFSYWLPISYVAFEATQ